MAELQRVTDFDRRPLGAARTEWPVEGPPLRSEIHAGLVHRLQYVGLRVAQGGAGRLPRVLQEGLVRTVAALGRRVDRKHTVAARDFIQTALPDLEESGVDRLVVEAWRHLLRVALKAEGAHRLIGAPLGRHYDVLASPEALDLVRGDGGLLAITAHTGNWELSPLGMVAVVDRPSYAIGKAPRNDFVARHVQRLRESQGIRSIARNGAMQAVPAAMRAGCMVGMLLDHRPRQKPVVAPYFGRPALCDRSAGILLRRVAAPLLFYGCYDTEDPWRFELRLTKVVPAAELEGLGPAEVAGRVNRELEALVLHRPEQAFWLHDRFRDAPAPDPTQP